jgi:translation initiation factor IF-1
LEKGIVLKSTGSRYKILYNDGKTIDCSIKGKLRIKEVRTTNPVAVGDNILFEIEKKTDTGIITEVLKELHFTESFESLTTFTDTGRKYRPGSADGNYYSA